MTLVLDILQVINITVTDFTSKMRLWILYLKFPQFLVISIPFARPANKPFWLNFVGMKSLMLLLDF